MVEGLSKRITGDWVELSEPSLSLSGLVEYFRFAPETLSLIGQRLSVSVEEGIIEYKEHLLAPVFALLEEMKYKNVSYQDLAVQNDEIGKLLFATLLQRLFASGGLESRRDERAKSAESDDGKELKEILSHVMARVKDDPSLKKNNAVKLILTQLAIYQSERETMVKLKPNIKDKQKAAAFRKNFDQTFQKISLTIRKYYAEFLSGEYHEETERNRVSLEHFPLRGLLSLFTKQAREFLRIRSTISFAIEGKYKVREICSHIYNEKEKIFAFLDQEKSAYRKLAKETPTATTGNGLAVSMLFASEIGMIVKDLLPREQ